MPLDDGQKEVDLLIAQTELDVEAYYKQAKEELTAKMEEYWRKLNAKDKVKRAQLEAGEITAEEYKQWRIGQLLIGSRWDEMRLNIAVDLTNYQEIAKSIVTGYTPEAYAAGFNFGTYSVEKVAKLDTSFTLYDRPTVERLIREKPQLLPELNPRSKVAQEIAEEKINKWHEKQIQSVCTQGVLQGESVPQIAERITNITKQDEQATIRYARTMMTGAENAGRTDSFARAEDMGIKLEQQWLATLDERTRETHRKMDGEHKPVGALFSNGCRFPGDPKGPAGEIWNCFVGETNVSFDSEVQKSYKHKYKGELVTVKSAAGVNFTCTPNHPILTTKGWVAAGKLHQGDNLVVTQVGRAVPAPRVKPDINHSFPSFRTLHKFLNMVFTQRATGLSVDFHGDVATANVEVVSKERFLGSNVNPRCNKPIDKIGFKNSDSFVSGKCHFMPRLRGINIAPFSLVRSTCKSLSFFFRGLRHSKEHRFRAVARNDVSIAKYSINNLPATTEIRSELLSGLSGKVFIDHVISIDVKAGSTHVYNLQTQNGYYFVNTIIPQSEQMCNGIMAIAKNCRCTLIPMLTGIPELKEDNDVTNTGLRNTDHMAEGGYQTYNDWKQGHMKPHPITEQKRKGENIRNAWIGKYKSAAARLGV